MAPSSGRIAPSPTGRQHLGNLSTALLAWALARRTGGRVVLRIEDLDPPRNVPDGERWILDDLRWLGIDWDEGPDVGGPCAPYRQSERTPLYDQALATLAASGLTYPCFCSRSDIQSALSAPHGFDPGTQYPGTCAGLPPAQAARRALSEEHAIRMRATGVIDVTDGLAGDSRWDLARVPGDFVLRRRDGLHAYQLAVVVDDIAMGVTDVLRGRDLLDSSPRQELLHRALGARPPRWWHAPLLLGADGGRLSKRRGDDARPALEAAGWTAPLLVGALALLWGWTSELGPLDAAALPRLWQSAPLARDRIPVPDALLRGPEAFAIAMRHLPRIA